MLGAIWQSLLIAGAAGVAAVVVYFVQPDSQPLEVSAHELSIQEALALEDALWVDARVESDYAASHFSGAFSLNEESWEAGFVALLDGWQPDSPIVVYCSSQSCLRSHQVAARLRGELGFDSVYSLTGGWEAIREQGLTVEELGQ